MKSYNTSIKVSLQHLTYRGILGKGVAATPNVSKGFFISKCDIKYKTPVLSSSTLDTITPIPGQLDKCYYLKCVQIPQVFPDKSVISSYIGTKNPY